MLIVLGIIGVLKIGQLVSIIFRPIIFKGVGFLGHSPLLITAIFYSEYLLGARNTASLPDSFSHIPLKKSLLIGGYE